MSASRSARLGLAQICLAGVLWGTGGLSVRVIRDRVPMSVVTISAWRMAVAALVLLLAVVVVRRLPEVGALLRAHPVGAVLVGLFTGGYQLLYFAAVVEVGLTVSTVVALGVAPVLLTVGESVAARRAPGWKRVAVLVVALTGLVLVSLPGGTLASGPRPGLGVLLAVASGAAYALATALGRPLAGSTSPLALVAVTSTAGALGLVPLGLLSSGPHTTTDAGALGVLVYLGVITLALAYGLLYAGLRTVTGGAAVIATLLEPVTAAFLAVLVLHERIGVLGLVGTALILTAVAGLGEGPAEAAIVLDEPAEPAEPAEPPGVDPPGASEREGGGAQTAAPGARSQATCTSARSKPTDS